jgi:hypothetical protein
MTIEENKIDFKTDRENDINEILISNHPKKVIVAGPGTGKTFLFQKVLEKYKDEGRTNFLAITFMGKLKNFLADDLAGSAKTMTLHAFARSFVLDNMPNAWEYYPSICDIIKEDLRLKGIDEFTLDSKFYLERTKYYQAIGDNDVVYYAIQICKKDETKIPLYDLILIDEFQDFNEIEAEFVYLLAKKNQIVIVGDDDQALYEFKGSSPQFIREIFAKSNFDFESHTLKYCSRCPEVIINTFHSLLEYFKLNNDDNERIKKEYTYYEPEKKKDSALNNKIQIIKQVPPNAIALLIHRKLKTLLERQKLKTVLIIGEGQSCKFILIQIAEKLREIGFKNVDNKNIKNKILSMNSNIIEGYKILYKGKNELLAWRILINDLENVELKNKLIFENYDSSEIFINEIPEDFKSKHIKNAKVLKTILTKSKSIRNKIDKQSLEELYGKVVISSMEQQEIFIDQLKSENTFLESPLAELDITVSSILGAKGLGADIVFVVGFDSGKLPAKDEILESEIYQMLVALTRAKKRIYFINSIGNNISQFLSCIDESYYEIVKPFS